MDRPADIRLVLPWPPSTNMYWRHIAVKGRPRSLLSREGRSYKSKVLGVVVNRFRGSGGRMAPVTGKVRLDIILCPPDNRRRDLDNFAGKALLDALTHAGVWEDDSQIVDMRSRWGEKIKGGRVVVELWDLSKGRDHA